MKLLLVEDDEMLRSSMSEVLVKQHFVVEKAKDFYLLSFLFYLR